jgi:Yip1 domain
VQRKIDFGDCEIMSQTGFQPVAGAAAEAPGLSQWQRLAYTFTAPSKTFEDIRRGNKSWWLPLIVGALAGYILFAAVAQKITIAQVVDNQIRMDPKAQERMANASPEQKAMTEKFSLGFTEGAFIGGPVIGIIGAAVVALGLWGTINFVFGGKATYGGIFAVCYYAWLPATIKAILGAIVIYAGMAPESFNIKNFSPTNLGAFLDPVETNKALYSLATSIDALTIWTLVLMGIGIATVAGVKRGSGYIAVFGWWAIFVMIGVGWNAMMG